MENGERLDLQEIEMALSRLSKCPKCNCKDGFWLGVKNGRAYAQCKGCATKLELFEIFRIAEAAKPSRWKFLRK
jgi:transcription elongation factor Elf1